MKDAVKIFGIGSMEELASVASGGAFKEGRWVRNEREGQGEGERGGDEGRDYRVMLT